MSANLRGHQNHSAQLGKLSKIIELLRDYRKRLVVVNKDWLSVLYEEELHQDVI